MDKLTAEKAEFIKTALLEAFNNRSESAEETVGRFFDKDFSFYVNNHHLDYNDMIARAKRIRLDTTQVEFEYITVLRDGDKIAEIHLTKAFKPDGSFSLTRAHNFYIFKITKSLAYNH